MFPLTFSISVNESQNLIFCVSGMCHQPFPHASPSLLFLFWHILVEICPTLPYQSTNVSYYSVINRTIDYRLVNYNGGWMISITKSFFSLFCRLRNQKSLLLKPRMRVLQDSTLTHERAAIIEECFHSNDATQ